MNAERIAKIKLVMEHEAEHATRIYEGDSDNYDGADASRIIMHLCRIISELLAEVETTKET